MYRLIGFDFDGTLADSGDWMTDRLNELAVEFNFKRVEAGNREKLRGLDSKGIVKELEVPLWRLPQIMARMRKLAERDHAQMRLFPGTPEVLSDLQRLGVRLAIVTSNSEECVRAILGTENCLRIEYFICGASMFGKARKLRTLLKMAHLNSSEVLYIGDETRDADASREAGIDFGGVGWGYAAVEALARHSPKYLFKTVQDIPQIVARG